MIVSLPISNDLYCKTSKHWQLWQKYGKKVCILITMKKKTQKKQSHKDTRHKIGTGTQSIFFFFSVSWPVSSMIYRFLTLFFQQIQQGSSEMTLYCFETALQSAMFYWHWYTRRYLEANTLYNVSASINSVGSSIIPLFVCRYRILSGR